MTRELHNVLAELTPEERPSVDAATNAATALKRTFDTWVVIGRGLQTLKAKADRLGGKKTYQRLREQHGLRNAVVTDAQASNILRVLERLPEVEAWRMNHLDERERYRWAAPNSVIKHCPIFATPGREQPKGLASLQALKRAKQQAEERAKEQEDELKLLRAQLKAKPAGKKAASDPLADLNADQIVDLVLKKKAPTVQAVIHNLVKETARDTTGGKKRAAKIPEELRRDDDSPGDTPEQRWQYSLSNMAADAITLPPYWDKNFGEKWKSFAVGSDQITLARQAAATWTQIADQLTERSRSTSSPPKNERKAKKKKGKKKQKAAALEFSSETIRRQGHPGFEAPYDGGAHTYRVEERGGRWFVLTMPGTAPVAGSADEGHESRDEAEEAAQADYANYCRAIAGH